MNFSVLLSFSYRSGLKKLGLAVRMHLSNPSHSFTTTLYFPEGEGKHLSGLNSDFLFQICQFCPENSLITEQKINVKRRPFKPATSQFSSS